MTGVQTCALPILGVNLFSGEQTLVERMGLSELNDELLKNSGYYQNKLLYK